MGTENQYAMVYTQHAVNTEFEGYAEITKQNGYQL
jgi:hypothetical protein